jgi:hypothetical protein
MSIDERDRQLFEDVLTVYRRFRDHAEIGLESSAALIAADLTVSYFAARTSKRVESVDESVSALINTVKYK